MNDEWSCCLLRRYRSSVPAYDRTNIWTHLNKQQKQEEPESQEEQWGPGNTAEGTAAAADHWPHDLVYHMTFHHMTQPDYALFSPDCLKKNHYDIFASSFFKP